MASGELVSALDEQGVPVERRQALLNSVLAGKVNPITTELLNHAVGSNRKANLLLAIDDLLKPAPPAGNGRWPGCCRPPS